jgi:hypothetical protein
MSIHTSTAVKDGTSLDKPLNSALAASLRNTDARHVGASIIIEIPLFLRLPFDISSVIAFYTSSIFALYSILY